MDSDLCIPNPEFEDLFGTDGPRKFDKENDFENQTDPSLSIHVWKMCFLIKTEYTIKQITILVQCVS